ncbi:hypothetical protein PoB_001967800 [Plakobranchus ocellatus]|uniref:Uncharacterized protein n=1 Tax=Plakobranchus ocellatus TaxID=259542 RepID=A0AAV3ZFC0_9GAST|nr:hypothetical protein PoB_001967800 [Plakobranchus ocellatus]
MHSNLENARIECNSDTEEGFFLHPVTEENVTTAVSKSLNFNFFFAVGSPDITKKYTDDTREFVEANCSVDVGSNGSLQWRMRYSDWLIYCWNVDSQGKISGNPPAFAKQSNDKDANFMYTWNSLTGPHIMSSLRFEIPDLWKLSHLMCTVDNPHGELFISEEHEVNLTSYVPCEKMLLR